MTPSLSILADPPPPPTAIGLIAGGGRLPILVAEGLREAGHPVHGLGLLGQYEPELPALCESFRYVGLLRVGSWGRILSRMDIHHAVMVGRVDKAKLMHDPLRLVRNTPDLRTVVARAPTPPPRPALQRRARPRPSPKNWSDEACHCSIPPHRSPTTLPPPA